MSYEYTIGLIDEESVLAECGPMRLVIRAWNGEQPQIALARQAAEKSIAYLEQIAQSRSMLSCRAKDLEVLPKNKLAREMITGTRDIGDEDLTPMCAVAGTIADAVADWLFKGKTTRVIVDNGGDIAIRLAEGETATVGIRPQVNSAQVSHVIRLDGHQSTWGVTTSGTGGRSLTRGIASAVSVLAVNASIADAAATAIANACFVEDDGIIQIPAEQIDSGSDLAGFDVTAKVGTLNSQKISLAVSNARQKAVSLSQKQLIIGAFIALDGVYSITEGMQEYISPLA